MQQQFDPSEVRFFEDLRRAEVLEDVNGNRLDTSNGIILVTCSDGDKMPDIFKHQSMMTFRIHPLARNGGGLQLPHNSPANRLVDPSSNSTMRLGDLYMQEILETHDIKGMGTVVLPFHFPCAIAGRHEIRARRLIELLVDAKNRIKTEMPRGVKVASSLHIEWPDGRKRTYFVSRDKWNAYCATLQQAQA